MQSSLQITFISSLGLVFVELVLLLFPKGLALHTISAVAEHCAVDVHVTWMTI